MTVKLIPLTPDGTPPEHANHELIKGVCEAMVGLYEKQGYHPPWIGYLAYENSTPVGTCAFKTPPQQGADGKESEIAYFTFPEFENRGIAKSMATNLIALATAHDPTVKIFANTLPVSNASNTILKKLGFVFAGKVHDPEDGLVWKWVLP